MGWYTNITLRGPAQAEIAAALSAAGRCAYVSSTVSGLTVVYDQGSERAWAKMGLVAQKLSEALACPSFDVLNFDEDRLGYLLFDRGEKLDGYDSYPNQFKSEPGEIQQFLATWVKERIPRLRCLRPAESDSPPPMRRTPSPPEGGDAQALCRLFGLPGDPAQVERVLRSIGDADFCSASDRHMALLKALDWPDAVNPIDAPEADPLYLKTFTSIRAQGPPEGWLRIG
jgi:hypothetical protein